MAAAKTCSPAAAVQMGHFIHQSGQSILSPEVLGLTKTALVDVIASTLSGARQPVVEIARSYVSGRSPGEATIIGGGSAKLPLDAAAFVNGTMGHATDYDDVSTTMWGHATAPVFPVVLALAEKLNLSGPRLLAAFLTGIEIEMRLGAAVAPHHYGVGWHPTGSIGVFGACAGAAAALGLSPEKSATALCIAATRATSLRANFGSMTKPLHVGFAARDGLEAALLAEKGVTAQLAAIDGAFGFIEVLAGGTSTLADQLEHLGRPYDLVSSGLAYKYYPSCSDTHIAVDTMLGLMEDEGISVQEIEHIRCGTMQSVFDNLVYHDPRSGLEGKFSLEYCLARALQNKRLVLDDFTDEQVSRPDTRRLMQKVDFFVDPAIQSDDFCSPAAIELLLRDGRRVNKLGTSARGHADRPLSEIQIAEKFFDCARIALPENAAGPLFETINNVENLPTVRPLAEALGKARE